MSRVDRLVLIKYVLEATPIFWMALAWIPRNILAQLQQLCSKYLWNGHQDKKIFACVSWNKYALPKKWGGLGLIYLPLFSQALAAKMGWTLLTGQNLWTTISYHKYIWSNKIMDWVRLLSLPKTCISIIWKALLHSLPNIKDNLVWRINDGTKAHIGLDSWTGGGGIFHLSRELIQHLHSHEIKVIAHIVDPLNTNIFSQGWKSTLQLDIPPQWQQEWHEYTNALCESHMRIKEGPNELI